MGIEGSSGLRSGDVQQEVSDRFSSYSFAREHDYNGDRLAEPQLGDDRLRASDGACSDPK